MPLSCDCYDGCWRDHSENWPCCFSNIDEADRQYAKAVKILPYGTYVKAGAIQMRFETEEYKKLVLDECYGKVYRADQPSIMTVEEYGKLVEGKSEE